MGVAECPFWCPFVCAIVMAAGVLGLRIALGSVLAPAIRLPVLVLSGACLYIVAIQMANVPAYSYLKGRAALVRQRVFGALKLR